MKRREFVQQSFFVAGGTILAPNLILSKEKSKGEKLTILHTNDTHSNIDPFPVNHAKYPGKGGVAKRYEVIQQVREEEENVLLLDAGDIFQGTPYFNKYNGVLEIKLMTQLGYDASTMGNHDFDIGLDGFLNAKQYGNFPFLCGNYNFKETLLNGETIPYKIFKKGKLKIGVFGLGVELKGLVPDNKYGATKYEDPIGVANEIAEELQDKNCDLVICLSHLGYSYENGKVSDLKLAEQTQGIDLIIGGHTHTFLSEPTQVENKEGAKVLVNQVGWAGINLGRIDFYFDKKNTNKSTPIEIR